MQYIARYVGGPLDGGLRHLAGKFYNTLVGEQLTQSGLINIAVYEYEESHESGDTTERIYRFVGTKPFAEGQARIGESKFIEG